MRKVVNISLPEELKNRVDEEIEKGHYASRSEFFRELLRDRIGEKKPDLSLEEIKEIVTPILKEANIKKASVFGSAVRGDLGSDSDIDFLVEMPEEASLFDLVRLQRKLGEALGREADVSTYSSVNEYFKEDIMNEQIKIYG